MSNQSAQCPFCGGTGGPVSGDRFNQFVLECTQCKALGPCSESEQAARAAWNRRAPPEGWPGHSFDGFIRELALEDRVDGCYLIIDLHDGFDQYHTQIKLSPADFSIIKQGFERTGLPVRRALSH